MRRISAVDSTLFILLVNDIVCNASVTGWLLLSSLLLAGSAIFGADLALLGRFVNEFIALAVHTVQCVHVEV